jgi:hypothetical protein
MYCDIFASQGHVRPRCPKFRAVKLAAVPCCYVMEVLGYFHILYESLQRQRSEACTTLISVFDGNLTVPNVISELERIIPGPWKWNVEENGNNSFKTVFPSKLELQRMVDCGVVHTKFQNAKIKIEERMVDNEVKFVLPIVWIEFTGLSAHLRDFLIIWAAGSIMGVTKDVDMEFTRQHRVSRLQVLVLNPNLIPQSVNIVIGESFYELKFRVEMNAEVGAPHPMDMDDNHEGDDSGKRK